MSIKKKVQRLDWFLSAQLGIDLRKTVRAFMGLPRYFRDLRAFSATNRGRMEWLPCLHDWHDEGGSTNNEYFWQDLIIARKIHANRPRKHVDVGSRVDGFVAHVASFREIEVFDVRPISAQIPGVVFKQADLMNPPEEMKGYCDSLSCLHALEHFGLGRYGDPIDPKGYESGLRNMAEIVAPGGVFYLSVPVGVERVEFNGQHVFHPETIIRLAAANDLSLQEMLLFTAESGLQEVDVASGYSSVGEIRYGLAMFVFVKQGKAA